MIDQRVISVHTDFHMRRIKTQTVLLILYLLCRKYKPAVILICLVFPVRNNAAAIFFLLVVVKKTQR